MIKSFVIISSMCLFCGTFLHAQSSSSYPREVIQIGAKVGMNYSNVWDERGQEFNADPKFGFAGGVFLGVPIGKFLGIQPEVLLSQKGWKGSGVLLGTAYSLKRTTTYLDIPLQLQVKPSDFLTVLAGPQYSYLLHMKDVYTLGSNSFEQEEEFKNDNVRKNILGFVAGADVIYSHVVVSGRFGWDFQTNNGDGTSNTPRYKNRWFQVTVGLKI
ncbi:MAG: PorT family protein [Saprospiraceae bacterium]|nr:PorT family protein [Saprospiraceae bacterium]